MPEISESTYLDGNVTQDTYYIETYGCQMNEHDSEKMSRMLEQMGFRPVSEAEQADVVIINTCSIREKAEHKVYSALGTLKSLKTKNPAMVTVVSGCVAQQERGRLLKKVQHLDAVVGTHRIADLPEIVERIRASRCRIERTEFSPDVKSLHLPGSVKNPAAVCSYVTIMQGCSNFCSYCVVPFTRGPEQSRPAAEIVKEVENLVEKGVREVTLLGQNVNAYGKDLNGRGTAHFASLLEKLDAIPRLQRIRFTTSHPRDFHEDLARAMSELKSVCEHIHLPLQTGSDRVLTAMKRGYTREQYFDKIRLLRTWIPDVAVTADIIVGFPGETEEDFELTMSALEQIRFDQIFSFKYSPRPGTLARTLPDQVPQNVKVENLARVHALQDAITQEYHRKAEGTVEEILVEGRRESGQWYGRTRRNKVANLESSHDLHAGDLVRVQIVRGLKHSLLAKEIDA
ncbi:MAG TPA: tRNA (N6-isopentenyl adenosine(37)-C2)-methylthiotransferase MiaB [Desulfomonilaceae bacterium]|nr:tRNA (N6-isopentenyl adenosine(37)-C2)-methylthiotransferase MiaB [Desulfomonilaceae bacterium]